MISFNQLMNYNEQKSSKLKARFDNKANFRDSFLKSLEENMRIQNSTNTNILKYIEENDFYIYMPYQKDFTTITEITLVPAPADIDLNEFEGFRINLDNIDSSSRFLDMTMVNDDYASENASLFLGPLSAFADMPCDEFTDVLIDEPCGNEGGGPIGNPNPSPTPYNNFIVSADKHSVEIVDSSILPPSYTNPGYSKEYVLHIPRIRFKSGILRAESIFRQGPEIDIFISDFIYDPITKSFVIPNNGKGIHQETIRSRADVNNNRWVDTNWYADTNWKIHEPEKVFTMFENDSNDWDSNFIIDFNIGVDLSSIPVIGPILNNSSFELAFKNHDRTTNLGSFTLDKVGLFQLINNPNTTRDDNGDFLYTTSDFEFTFKMYEIQ